jgi:hypothetical protein
MEKTGTLYEAEDCIDWILINPVLPDDFGNKDISERSQKEMWLWDCLPFIETISFEENQADASYNEYHERIKRINAESNSDLPTESRDKWEADREKRRKEWLESFPTGIRYEVRCLDSGAWDNSTWWGWFGNIDDAVACAKSGKPSWR